MPRVHSWVWSAGDEASSHWRNVTCGECLLEHPRPSPRNARPGVVEYKIPANVQEMDRLLMEADRLTASLENVHEAIKGARLYDVAPEATKTDEDHEEAQRAKKQREDFVARLTAKWREESGTKSARQAVIDEDHAEALKRDAIRDYWHRDSKGGMYKLFGRPFPY